MDIAEQYVKVENSSGIEQNNLTLHEACMLYVDWHRHHVQVAENGVMMQRWLRCSCDLSELFSDMGGQRTFAGSVAAIRLS